MTTSKTIVRKILSGVFAGILTFSAFAQDLQKLADADNGFAFDLLKQIAQEQPTQNIFISPFSVSTVLQMLGNGAAGKTKSEIQSVLKTENLPQDKLNVACRELNQSLKSQTDVILDLADGIWYQNDFHLEPDFVATDRKYFGVELAPVDFESPKSADIINKWAGKETRGKISDVVLFPFPPLTRVVLANAIYFKGKWVEPFDKRLTRVRDFHLANGDVKQVSMLNQHKKFSFLEGEGFQAVRLPYAGDRLQMYLFLPATNSSPKELLATLDGKKWHDAIAPAFTESEGLLMFPKFKLDYDISLNDSLKVMGMRLAFSAGADFSTMADDQLFVSQVTQKSFVAVDEEGTEAAAVTTVEMSLKAAPRNAVRMIVDRPFLFLISDQATGTVLFTGIVNEPTP
jgi:serpin B